MYTNVYIFPSGADTDVKDRNSMTPLMLATRNGREEVKLSSNLKMFDQTLHLHNLHVRIVYMYMYMYVLAWKVQGL